MKKGDYLTFGIIFTVVIFSFIIMYRPIPQTTSEIAKCIGEKTTLYTQLGCSACEHQKNLFGENYQNLTVIDCFYERDKCNGIASTPTWVIGEKKIIGAQSIEELQKLTGC